MIRAFIWMTLTELTVAFFDAPQWACAGFGIVVFVIVLIDK